MFQQQVQTGSALIEGVERMSAVMVCPNHRAGFAQCNSYTMDMDWGNRNCYNCRGFGHLARNCRNRGAGNKIGKERRLEYGGNKNNRQRRMIKKGNGQNNGNNLNGDGNCYSTRVWTDFRVRVSR